MFSDVFGDGGGSASCLFRKNIIPSPWALNVTGHLLWLHFILKPAIPKPNYNGKMPLKSSRFNLHCDKNIPLPDVASALFKKYAVLSLSRVLHVMTMGYFLQLQYDITMTTVYRSQHARYVCMIRRPTNMTTHEASGSVLTILKIPMWRFPRSFFGQSHAECWRLGMRWSAIIGSPSLSEVSSTAKEDKDRRRRKL